MHSSADSVKQMHLFQDEHWSCAHIALQWQYHIDDRRERRRWSAVVKSPEIVRRSLHVGHVLEVRQL